MICFRLRSCLAVAAVCLTLLSDVTVSSLAQAQNQTPAPAAQPEALSGEYTNALEPDTPLSFSVQDGKLVYESERQVPVELNPISGLSFGNPDAQETLRFSLDPTGQGASMVLTDRSSSTVYRRTGAPVHHLFHDYRRAEVMIPMRDGIKLHAVILKPADIAGPLPIILQRTPYGSDVINRTSFFNLRPEMARAGYIYVLEDIRGRFKSEGEFVMMRPLADHHDPKAVDESTDAYATIAWLVANVPGTTGAWE